MHRKLMILSAAVVIFIAGAMVATRLQTVHGLPGHENWGWGAVEGVS